ncbi:MAG: hypothetical protein QOH48_2113 [Actinomycetota bacterium]|nr:hypothetical protein [Actinomycetota bacterium]
MSKRFAVAVAASVLLSAGAMVSAHAASCKAIKPGTNISSTINRAAGGTTFCIYPGTYKPGSTLTPKSGDTIRGLGAVPDDVSITTTTLPIIFDLSNTTGVSLTDLAISGAVNECPGTNCGATGEGVYNGANVTASQLHVYSNHRVGLGGQHGLTVSYSHIDHNGAVTTTTNLDYVSAGIKSVNPLTVTHSRIDHNNGNGVHCDRNCGAFTMKNNVVLYNTLTGIHYEIGQGPATIAYNTVKWNNTLNMPYHAGIEVNDSQNIDIFGNKLGGNGHHGIHVWEDSRSSTTGFHLLNVTIHDNVANGDEIGNCSFAGVTCY